MELTSKYPFHVYPQDIDAERRMRITSLGSSILNAAGIAANDNGFGTALMQQKGLTWVLSRLLVEMESYPKEDDTIYIETWVEDYGRLFTTRNYCIYDHNDKVIGHASTLWAIIDLNTRRSVSLSQFPEFECFATDKPSAIGKPEKIEAVKDELQSSHCICFSDIDFNGHTNSMKYLEWMLDAYPIDKIYARSVQRFELNYLHEVLCGETVNVGWRDAENTTFFEVATTDGKAICRAKVQWAE